MTPKVVVRACIEAGQPYCTDAAPEIYEIEGHRTFNDSDIVLLRGKEMELEGVPCTVKNWRILLGTRSHAALHFGCEIVLVADDVTRKIVLGAESSPSAVSTPTRITATQWA